MLSLGSIRTGPNAFPCESLKASVEPSCLSKDSAESPHTSPALHFCFLQALKLLRVSIYDRQEAPFYAASSVPCLLVHLIHGVAISAGILAHAVEPAECICSSKPSAVHMRMSLETGLGRRGPADYGIQPQPTFCCYTHRLLPP